MRTLLFSLIACATIGACAHSHGRVETWENTRPGNVAQLLYVGELGHNRDLFYLVDPVTESCHLLVWRFESDVIAPADCATLARNYPAAAKSITWLAPAAPPAPPAPQP